MEMILTYKKLIGYKMVINRDNTYSLKLLQQNETRKVKNKKQNKTPKNIYAKISFNR